MDRYRSSFVLLFLFSAIILIPSGSTASLSRTKKILRIHFDKTSLEQFRGHRLARALDIAGQNISRRTLDVIGDRETFEGLRQLGFNVTVEQKLSTQTLSKEYKTYKSLSEYLQKKQEQFSSILKVFKIGRSVEGRDILAVKISENVEIDQIKPTILFDSLHHAREVMTIEVAIDIIDTLTSGYGTDQTITNWVDKAEIWVVPAVNPDGLERVWTSDSWWRKNTARQGDWVMGVDLNRNYPFAWGSCYGSSGFPSSDSYRGHNPGSEPEIQAMMALEATIKPVFTISYHSYSELVIYPYGCDEQYPSEKELIRKLAAELASRLVSDSGDGTYTPGTPWEILYSVDGDDLSWQYAVLGTIPFTIEINSSYQGFQPDYNSWREITVTRQRPGWGFLMNELTNHLVYGTVRDADTGEPLEAEIRIKGIPYRPDERLRRSAALTGEYFKMLAPGNYQISFLKDGYQPVMVDIEIGGESIFTPIKLRAGG